jgi:hypothetical protein
MVELVVDIQGFGVVLHQANVTRGNQDIVYLLLVYLTAEWSLILWVQFWEMIVL